VCSDVDLDTESAAGTTGDLTRLIRSYRMAAESAPEQRGCGLLRPCPRQSRSTPSCQSPTRTRCLLQVQWTEPTPRFYFIIATIESQASCGSLVSARAMLELRISGR
jgi:hypothetical protein